MDKCKERAVQAEDRVMTFFAKTYGTLGEKVMEKYGDEGVKLVYDAYHESVRDNCLPGWKEMGYSNAEQYAQWLLADLMEGYDFEYVEKTPDSVRINMKSCPLATHFIACGFGKFGMLFCDVDYDMIEDFNAATGSNLGFERDKVLMDGQECCNHHIFVKK